MAHAKQILVNLDPKKGSVRFQAKESDKHPLFTTLYLMRDAAKKYLGISDLDKAEEIEVTVRVVKSSKANHNTEMESEDDD